MAGSYERDMNSRPDAGDRADRRASQAVAEFLAQRVDPLPMLEADRRTLHSIIARAVRHG